MKRLLYKSPCVTVTEAEPLSVFCTSNRPEVMADESEHLYNDLYDEETGERKERFYWGI